MKLLLCIVFVTFLGCNVLGLATGGQHKRFKEHADRAHVLEELEHQISQKNTEQMTDEELQYYYFTLHDYDKNKLLDGLEIMKALTHAHHEHHGNDTSKVPTEDEIVNVMENVLRDDDYNGDGYVSFFEFMAERAAQKEQQEQQNQQQQQQQQQQPQQQQQQQQH